MFDISNKKIWVAGHNGMVGSAIVRRLKKENCKILKVEKRIKSFRSKVYRRMDL